MTVLVTAFLTVLAGSFALLVSFISPARGSKSTRLRVGEIQYSVSGREPGGIFETKLRQRHLRTMRFNAVLKGLRIQKHLEALLLQADCGIGAGGCAMLGVCAAGALATGTFLISGSALAAVPAALAGVMAPLIWLRMRRGRRVGAFNAALADAIDLLARALRAGHSVGSAMEMVGQQSPEPLAAEFTQVFQQQRLGLPFRDALMQMCERMPSRDLSFLITAILIQKETGGDLTDILDRTAHVIRERIRIEGEVRTRTAQGRLTGWILAGLPVAMLALLNLVNPGYSDVLLHDPQGRQLLWLGAGLIVTGGLIIRKIVDVKV